MKKIVLLLFILCAYNFGFGQMYAPEIQVKDISNNSVGIGTPTPYYLLDCRFVNNDTKFLTGDSGNWGANGIRIENVTPALGSMSALHLRVGDSDVHLASIRRGANLSDLGLFFEGKLTHLFKDGFFGIGTLNPYYSMHSVFSNSNTSFVGGNSGDYGSNGLRLENTSSIIESMSAIHLRVGDADTHIATIRKGNNNADLAFFSEGAETIRFKKNGNVGIGFNNPAYKLEVNGIVRASSFSAVSPPWADFVFDEDYQLIELGEVEEFIKQHKHLPDIPSENEVKENGIDLVEMNKLLLQKIEELTLYSIQQNNRIQNQSKIIENQGSELDSYLKRLLHIENLLNKKEVNNEK